MNKLRDYLIRKNLYSIVLHLLVVVLAVEVIVLMKQNKELKEGRASRAQESIKEGDYFSLADLTPVVNDAQLDTLLRKQLIFVFTTRCPFCQEMLPMWKYFGNSLAARNNVAILGISLDPLQETRTYLDQQNVTFPVFLPSNKESFSNKNKLHSVPQTMIRRSDGIVEKVWRGRLSIDEYHEIVKAISDGIIN
jgi:peroxiredoxin